MEITELEIKTIKDKEIIDEKILILSIYDDLKKQLKRAARKEFQQPLLEKLEGYFFSVIQETTNQIDAQHFIANLIIKLEEDGSLSSLLKRNITNLSNHFNTIKEEKEYTKIIEQYSNIPFQEQVMIEDFFKQINQRINTYYNQDKEQELRKEFTNNLKEILDIQSTNWHNNSMDEFKIIFNKTIKQQLFDKIKNKEITTKDLNNQYQWFFQKFSSKEQYLLLIISCYDIAEKTLKAPPKELNDNFAISPIEYYGMLPKIGFIFLKTYIEIINMPEEEIEEIVKNPQKTKI